jgi:S-adenosylmethionine:tRNA ribosyltransferase-isomerase
MLLSDFDFVLPPELIAQQPLASRDGSRMLVVDRASSTWEDHKFTELPDLLRGDELIVVNNARVIPARLFGYRAGTRAAPRGKNSPRSFLRSRIEVLLVRRIAADVWEALVRPGRKVQVGEHLTFEGDGADADTDGGGGAAGHAPALQAEVVARGELGLRQLRFYGVDDVSAAIDKIGHVPLPPYIKRADAPADRERYQTIFATAPTAVAAPTAGLHFTDAVLERLHSRGLEIHEITLDVGLGTFQPIHAEDLNLHQIHEESYEISQRTADAIAAAKRDQRPVLAVGTTVVRALEDAALKSQSGGASFGNVQPGQGSASLFIRSGHQFLVVDQLLTNFHLPRSTLFVLVAAFGGLETLLSAYQHAVRSGYRFYSYGDCMLLR